MHYLASIERSDGTYSLDVQSVDDDGQQVRNPFFSKKVSTPSGVRAALESLCEGVPDRIELRMKGAAYVALGEERVPISMLVIRHNNPERCQYLRQ